MPFIFKEGRVNFPASEDEFNARIAEIKKLINNDDEITDVNVVFVKTAFKFMEDCGLITEKIANSLTDADFCKNCRIKFPYHPHEGALRAVNNDDDVFVDDARRFYSGANSYGRGNKMHVELLNGQHYLISNDWYSGDKGNKRAFFEWLKRNAQIAFDKNKKSRPQKLVSVSEEDLKFMISSIRLLHRKIDSLIMQVEELKNIRS